MAKNFFPKIAKMFGLKVFEEFKITNNHGSFRFTETGLEYWDTKLGKWMDSVGHIALLYHLIHGDETIIMLPWKMTRGECYWTFAVNEDKELTTKREVWWGTGEDLARFKAGWVFERTTDIDAALPKVAGELNMEYKLLGSGNNG